MLTMSIPIDMEYVSYFLVDCECARNLWDPMFLYATPVEQMDRNNSILQLFYKPIPVLNYPWYVSVTVVRSSTIQSSPRSFCVWRHFTYDEEAKAYFVFFSSTTCSSVAPSSLFVEGELRTLSCFP